MENFKIQENTSEILSKKHDEALEEASNISNKIQQLENKLYENSIKKFPHGDKKSEREINEEVNNITKMLGGYKSDLKEKWKEIHQIQGKLLDEGKNQQSI
jgi:predicted phage-related endonuclease